MRILFEAAAVARANPIASYVAVFLRDIWPKRDELQAVEKKFVIPRLFQEVYSKITTGNERWNKLEVPLGQNYEWEEDNSEEQKGG